ncbi:MAG: histone deacetylase [Desulfatiglandales bacterium]
MGRVGIIRDERFLEHMPGPTHPEHPRRLKAVYEMIDREFKGRLREIRPRPATLGDVELVHSPDYIERFLKTPEQDFTMLSPDTPVSKNSYISAFLAVGAVIEAIKGVTGGVLNSCFALVRPPGHHALKDRAMGFCIFNNLAIGARFAQAKLGIRRILIIDWDVHFGNGISEEFYSDPGVFYLSTHRLELFPYSGRPEEMGEGDGLGFNLNVPLPPHMGTKDFVALYQNLLKELIPPFNPQLTLIAAGFDVHSSDPLGRLSVEEKAFYEITQSLRYLLKEEGSERIVLSLEGGYDPLGLALCVKETIRGLIDPLKGFEATKTDLSQEILGDALNRLRALGVLG